MGRIWRAGLSALVAVLGIGFAFAPAALAQGGPGGDSGGGQSTPGVIVMALNPGTAPGSDLRLTLVAHSARSTVPNPDCRPAAEGRPPPALRCWGTLVLQAPDAGGLTVRGFLEVHKVAVGETSCGDDQGSDCDGDGGCQEGGCDSGGMAAAAGSAESAEPVHAQVNGIATVINPGSTTMTAGQTVQVHITLYDNGTARYQDQVFVQVRPQGPQQNTIPWAYQAGPEAIQQVDIHYPGSNG